MANQRDVSKQKRSRQNRAEREARVARATAAKTPPDQRGGAARAKPSAPSRSTPATTTRGKRSDRADRAAVRRGLADGRLGQVPVDIDTLQGGFIRKVVQVPGGMQVLMATVLVLVLTAMNAFMHTIIVKGAPKGAPATQTFFDTYGAGALLLLAPPVILVGNAVLFSLHPRRRRMWTASAVLLGAFSLLIPQFLFPAGFLGYAVMRSRKIEDPRPPRGASVDPEQVADDAQ